MIPVLAALGVVNLLATSIVARSCTYSTGNRIAQLPIIWLVPVLGVLTCIAIARSDAATAGRDKPQDFVDNAGVG